MGVLILFVDWVSPVLVVEGKPNGNHGAEFPNSQGPVCLRIPLSPTQGDLIFETPRGNGSKC